MYLVTWPSCAYLADIFLSYLTTPGGGDDLKRRPNLMPDVPGPCDGPSLGSRVLFASKSRYSGQSGRVVRVLPIHMYLCFHPPESAARARARDSADAYANGWRPSTGREPVRLSGSWHIRWHIRGDLRPHLQVPR